MNGIHDIRIHFFRISVDDKIIVQDVVPLGWNRINVSDHENREEEILKVWLTLIRARKS